jgi:hypothetical protein
MNGSLAHIEHEGHRIANLAEHLRPATFGQTIQFDQLRNSLIAIACRMGTPDTLAKYNQTITPEWHNEAISLLNDRELGFAICDILPRPWSITYTYLKALELWNASGKEHSGLTIHGHFTLALILLGRDLALRFDNNQQIEALAYRALKATPALCEYLPELEEILRLSH